MAFASKVNVTYVNTDEDCDTHLKRKRGNEIDEKIKPVDIGDRKEAMHQEVTVAETNLAPTEKSS